MPPSHLLEGGGPTAIGVFGIAKPPKEPRQTILLLPAFSHAGHK